MKITKQGTVPDLVGKCKPNDIVQFECYYCNTEFECEFRYCEIIEAQNESFKVEARAIGKECPTCKVNLSSTKIKERWGQSY